MSVPSMVHRSGDSLVVRSVVSGDALYGTDTEAAVTKKEEDDAGALLPGHHQQQQHQPLLDDKDLPECKIKRNYSCASCDYFTQNPRNYLYHLRDVHHERVKIYECPNCLYASKHFQKLLRHTKMVHGTTNGVEMPDFVRAKAGRKRPIQEIEATATTTTTTATTKTIPVTVQSPTPPLLTQAAADEEEEEAEEDEEEEDEENGEAETDAEDELTDESNPDKSSSSSSTAATATSTSTFRCPYCTLTTKTRALLDKHTRDEHIKSKYFRCSKCSYMTHLKARFTKHVKYHSMPMIKCDMCDFRTPYKWNLDRHCKNHNGRGAFRCSACNFTADIKQSLTVHEMNHHVPPVGQAAGLGVGRRRNNKVGASDSAVVGDDTTAIAQVTEQTESGKVVAFADEDNNNKKAQRLKIYGKKLKTANNNQVQHHHHHHQQQQQHGNGGSISNSSRAYGADFIDPDDIIHHANGNIYIKSKCKLCNFKSAWDGEMAKHEQRVHNIVRNNNNNNNNSEATRVIKKAQRPIPNLIPIPTSNTPSSNNNNNSGNKLTRNTTARSSPEMEPTMTQEFINDICAKSANSSLKDFASLFNSEDVFKDVKTPSATAHHNSAESSVPDLIPASLIAKNNNNNNNPRSTKSKGPKAAPSFFDKLKEKLHTTDVTDLTCQYCGHESKCLTESASHQKTCGKERTYALQNAPIHMTVSSTRCKHCRQRCKSSADLVIHMRTCAETLKALHEHYTGPFNAMMMMMMQQQELQQQQQQEPLSPSSHMEDIKEEEEDDDDEDVPHPMENRVFVWNNIEAPMDVDYADDGGGVHANRYADYAEDRADADNVSLDLSIRTQSPCSDNSYTDLGHAHLSQPTTASVSSASPAAAVSAMPPSASSSTPTTDKIPTHGTDISVAQHKRVFKCPHCSFWASTASRFHVHIVGHLNKKPFECSLCSYRSNWRWDITKHIKLKSVRDPAHEEAKVLMTDETGRRNYTKYNKYLTEIHLSTGDGGGGHADASNNAARGRHPYDPSSSSPGHAAAMATKTELPKLSKAPSSSDFSPLLRNATLRPPPALKAADGALLAKINEKKRHGSNNNNNNGADAKRTQWKCKKCNFRDASRDKLLEHVKGHYPQASLSGTLSQGTAAALQVADNDERHCRLKHSGDIRVVVGTKNGVSERMEIDEQSSLIDDISPDSQPHHQQYNHVDMPQLGTHKCSACPYSSDDRDDYDDHLKHHQVPSHEDNGTAAATIKCNICVYYANGKEDLYDHMKLHGIREPDDYYNRYADRNGNADADSNKRHRCSVCPYVTNSKSQYQYHKQFHRPRGGQYSCSHCGYNVSKRHLLHQHLKVHGINVSPQKPSDALDLTDEMNDDIEEIQASDYLSPSSQSSFLQQQHHQMFPDIPLVWVSKHGKFYKMYKCRYCPHVNLRKVNIQEHEKMHGTRERNPNASSSSRANEIEHHCQECNYVCNNAGVLSSHSKVHQGSSGTIHCLVDGSKTDEEQMRELGRALNICNNAPSDTSVGYGDNDFDSTMDASIATTGDGDDGDESVLYFCDSCPARFLKETEYNIHVSFHGARLYYKCEYCTYTARQKPHLLAHNKIHMDEYQTRTKVLQSMYAVSQRHRPARTCIKTNQNGEFVWIIDEPRDDIGDYEVDELPLLKSYKSTNNVPLSGTELFLQKEEANMKRANASSMDKVPPAIAIAPPLHNDPQFGTLVNGNPKFIYPTSLKNGRKKEKRYKCHKCPSAFEKREQYKVHLSLHGAKQRYKCEQCDYAVKYYANYVQHLKKHQMNLEAQAAKRTMDDDECDETEELMPENNNNNDDGGAHEERASKNLSSRNVVDQLSVADRQYLKLSQSRYANEPMPPILQPVDERKLFWCPYCPYTNYRKDSVDNHQKRHIAVSGSPNNYTCKYCDYSVPHNHFLKEHTKLHFQTNKTNRPDGYLNCNDMKLTAKIVDNDHEDIVIKNELSSDDCDDDDNKELIFKDNGIDADGNRFEPDLRADVAENLNNNNNNNDDDGEKMLVNAMGEPIDCKIVKEEDVNDSMMATTTEECTSISQINSDN